MTVINPTAHWVDLDNGRMLAPGDEATTQRSPRVEQLLATGQLVEKPQPPGKSKPAPKPEPKGAVTPPAGQPEEENA